MSEDKNLLETITAKLKNHPLIVVMILISMGVTGLAAFTDSASQVLTAINHLRNNQQQENEKLDQLISQCWTNEGDTTIQPPYIDVCLESKQGEVRGFVDTYNIKTGDVWKGINLIGVRRGSILKLKAIQISQGEEIKVGEFQAELIQQPFQDNLDWTTLNVNADDGYFPEKTTLFPHTLTSESY